MERRLRHHLLKQLPRLVGTNRQTIPSTTDTLTGEPGHARSWRPHQPTSSSAQGTLAGRSAPPTADLYHDAVGAVEDHSGYPQRPQPHGGISLLLPVASARTCGPKWGRSDSN